MVIAMQYEECKDNIPILDQMLASNPECEMCVDDVITMEEDILITYAFFIVFILG